MEIDNEFLDYYSVPIEIDNKDIQLLMRVMRQNGEILSPDELNKFFVINPVLE